MVNLMNPNLFAQASPAHVDLLSNSPYEFLHRAGGHVEVKVLSIAGTGAEIQANLFLLSENPQLLGVLGIFTDISEVTVVSGCYFDLWDGTASDLVTADGVDCSGATLHSMIIKDEDKGQEAVFLKSDQVRYQEGDQKDIFQGGIMGDKHGVSSWLRFRVDTDGNTDCEITFYCIWTSEFGDSIITPV